MAYEFRMVHLVEFADTDMAGIMHFANFFRYMEATEHAFLRSLGLSVHMTLEGRTVGWPRVHASCDYLRPLRYEDRVEVHLVVREKREKALSYDFTFRKLLGEEPDAGYEEVARGRITAVCVAIDESVARGQPGRMKSIPIPVPFSECIAASPVSEGTEAP